MSKQLLENALMYISDNETTYAWNLYFFRKDNRKGNPYIAQKIKFKNDTYLPHYVTHLANCILRFQLSAISEVQNYDGENTKITCDKIDLTDEIISSAWRNLIKALTNASSENLLQGAYGYLLCGEQSTIANETIEPITFIKIANPIINVKNKKYVTYTVHKDEDELESLNDDIYRLYLTVDAIVYKNKFYAFNHAFESALNMQKTMDTIRQHSIRRITETDAIANCNIFEKYAKSYKSSRTFITLNENRVNEILKISSRKKVSEKLHINLDNNDKFIIDTEEKVALFIKYLCYKVFVEDDTKKLLEANAVLEISL